MEEREARPSREQLVALEALSRSVPHQDLARTLGVPLEEVAEVVRRAVDAMHARNEVHAVVTAIRRGLI